MLSIVVCIALTVFLLTLILINLKNKYSNQIVNKNVPIIKQMDILDAEFIEITIEQSPTKTLSLEQQFPKLKAYQ